MTNKERLEAIEKKYMNQTMASETAWLLSRVKVLTAALEEIKLGNGAYSQDQLTHAGNCIENMKHLAQEALNGEVEK